MGKLLAVLLISCFILLTYGYTNAGYKDKIERMSAAQALHTLEIMDKIGAGTHDPDLDKELKDLTGLGYSPDIRDELYDVINKNMNKTSFFMKMVGLVSFQNTIIVAMVLVGVAFMFFLAHDLFIGLLFMFGAYAMYFVVRFLLNKRFFYANGLAISCITMYFKPDEITNPLIRSLFIFDWLTPMFGCIIFGIVTFMIYNDLVKSNNGGASSYNKKPEASYQINGLFVTICWALVAIRHNNWMIGVLTIMMLFFTLGFLFGSMMMGYYTGFTNNESLMRCFGLSVVLNAIMLGVKVGFITGNVTDYANVFENGVYFWGSFVGSISLLVMSDEWYLRYNNTYTDGLFTVMQVIMATYCFVLLYFGNVFYISEYRSIGGTFLVLWGLDMEKTILQKLGKGNMTLMLFIVLVNLYYIKQLITWYPEYCIF
jgi:hypothetical protein